MFNVCASSMTITVNSFHVIILGTKHLWAPGANWLWYTTAAKWVRLNKVAALSSMVQPFSPVRISHLPCQRTVVQSSSKVLHLCSLSCDFRSKRGLFFSAVLRRRRKVQHQTKLLLLSWERYSSRSKASSLSSTKLSVWTHPQAEASAVLAGSSSCTLLCEMTVYLGQGNHQFCSVISCSLSQITCYLLPLILPEF